MGEGAGLIRPGGNLVEDQAAGFIYGDTALDQILRKAALEVQATRQIVDGGDAVALIRADRDRPITGTRLLREWHGVEQIVTVTPGGFEWQGRPYQSLSAIARAITGTRWNG